MEKIYTLKRATLIFSALLLMFHNLIVFIMTYAAVNIILGIILVVTTKSNKKRLFAILAHAVTMVVQAIFSVYIVSDSELSLFHDVIAVVLSYLLLVFSFRLERFLEIRNYHNEFFYTTKKAQAIYFSEIDKFKDGIVKSRERFGKLARIMNLETINEIITDVRRNNSFSYINNGTLTEDYFDFLETTKDDLAVYLVLSDTGSVASQTIAVFTEKEYNHMSISFDRELKSLVSYNGGERVNPPGLNSEMISSLQKKEDAAIYVYRLEISLQQKEKMISKIREINTEGSAYNLLGIMLKKSVQPNIMYCSQFVYSLLKYANAAYFEKNTGDIKPTDLVELDYERKLKFEYKIVL